MSPHPLDRPVWNMLTGPQSSLNLARSPVARIDPGYGPFAAARDAGHEAQAALAALLRDAGDTIWLVEREAWPAPPGMRVLKTASLVQMVAADLACASDDDLEIELLSDGDAAAMTDLARATAPGPWGPQTHRYGDFYGVRLDGRLAAMAGERMRPAEGFAEVSGVCTWPQYRGRGLAAGLIRRVMAGFVARGDTPFLHSYAANDGAIRLYRSLGFEVRCEMVATVLATA